MQMRSWNYRKYPIERLHKEVLRMTSARAQVFAIKAKQETVECVSSVRLD
jgi:hypothetical protein